MKTLGALSLAVMLASAPVTLSAPVKGAEVVGQAPCMNGTYLTIKFFDPDPENPDAGIFEYWLDGTRLAAMDAERRLVYVDALHKTISVDEAAATYGSPCSLPDPGRGA